MSFTTSKVREHYSASSLTERIKSALGAIARHLAGARPGLWIERMDAGGQAIVEAAPATSLYHLTAAFTDDAVLAVS